MCPVILGRNFLNAEISAKVAFLWFLLLIGTGIYNITTYPGIFRALDPSRAVLCMFFSFQHFYVQQSISKTVFVRTRDYDLLAGILLALTGCEAVFANLGQFNAASIRVSIFTPAVISHDTEIWAQISFCCFVYPGLVLAYLGQGARLIVDGENVIQNAFYKSIPGSENGPLFWCVDALIH